MSKLLFVTVGGSFQPVLTAIQTVAPDRVIFICSRETRSQVDGPGKPCELRRGQEVIERRPNLATQAGLTTRFNPDTDIITLQDVDDLSEVYCACVQAIRAALKVEPALEIAADYTGGTKTMSAALVLAALDWNVKLYVTSAPRHNIIGIEAGQITARAPSVRSQIERFIGFEVPRALERYTYPALIAEIRRLLQETEVASEQKAKLQGLYGLCRGLDEWDRFDHAMAWEYLQVYLSGPTKCEALRDLVLFLKRVISSRKEIDPRFSAPVVMNCHRYEIVQDLLLNAERRAATQRYDDAVGRLYRALELTAQIRLRTRWGISSSNVDLAKVPETLHPRYAASKRESDGKIKLGLWDDYLLLQDLRDEPFEPIFSGTKAQIHHALNKRNESLFAHGFRPVTEEDFRELEDVFAGFIHRCIAALPSPGQAGRPVQFPTAIPFAWAQPG